MKNIVQMLLYIIEYTNEKHCTNVTVYHRIYQ